MRKQNNRNCTHHTKPASRVYSLCASLLLAILLLQPVVPIFAAEESVVSEPSKTEDASEVTSSESADEVLEIPATDELHVEVEALSETSEEDQSSDTQMETISAPTDFATSVSSDDPPSEVIEDEVLDTGVTSEKAENSESIGANSSSTSTADTGIPTTSDYGNVITEESTVSEASSTESVSTSSNRLSDDSHSAAGGTDESEMPFSDEASSSSPALEETVSDSDGQTPLSESDSSSTAEVEVPESELLVRIDDELRTPLPEELSSETFDVAPPEYEPALPTDVDDENQSPDNTDLDAGSQASLPVNLYYSDDSRFVFSKDECVALGDGSYYCSEASSSPGIIGMNRVYAAPDSTGDTEIFIEQNSRTIQITENEVDDGAPYYDEVSETIVWHRLVDGRYQIMEYDLSTEEERQLTSDRYNNMEPTRYGDIVVWQGWIGNDWEIMLDEDGELAMLTDNTVHDVAPAINGDYIVWQSFDDNAWRVKVYDRLTKRTETISDADGGSVENPRFVLVYDTKLENGDIETKGYDLMSGEVVPLSATPAPLPAELPEPDQTGENRALVQPTVQVQSKPQEDVDGNDDGTLGTETDPSNAGDDTSSPATSTDDLIITSITEVGTSTTEEGADASILDDTNLHIPDLEIAPLEYPEDTVVGTSTEHIEEVIVTPYVEPIIQHDAELQDSQEAVAQSE